MLGRSGRGRLLDAGACGNSRAVCADATALPCADGTVRLRNHRFRIAQRHREARSPEEHGARDQARRASARAGVFAPGAEVHSSRLRLVFVRPHSRARGAWSRAMQTAIVTWWNRYGCIPTRETLAEMMREAGFEDVRWHNLSGRHSRLARRFSLLGERRACSRGLATSLEGVLNRNLHASLTARRAAAELEGLCMDMGVSAAQPILRMSVEGGRLRFAEPDDKPSGVTLAGGWRRLLDLLGGDHTGARTRFAGRSRRSRRVRPAPQTLPAQPGRGTGPFHRRCLCA